MPPMKDVQRRQEIRRHWLARPEHKRTANDLLIFHGWLEDNHPYLLKAGEADPYQQLKLDLGGVWHDERG
jgi:hypothetical protein